MNSTDVWQMCRYEAVWELALRRPSCYKSGVWVLFFGIVKEEKKKKKKKDGILSYTTWKEESFDF